MSGRLFSAISNLAWIDEIVANPGSPTPVLSSIFNDWYCGFLHAEKREIPIDLRVLDNATAKPITDPSNGGLQGMRRSARLFICGVSLQQFDGNSMRPANEAGPNTGASRDRLF
jgi:hypothetical protein